MKRRYLICMLYAISIISTIIFGFIFPEYIVLGTEMIEVLVVIAVLFVQVGMMCSNDSVESTNFNNGTLNKMETKQLFNCIGIATQWSIPVLFPMLIFFNIWIKIAVSLSVTFATYIIGIIAFKLKYGKNVKSRINNEKIALQKQLRKENEGII
ncbi:MAG: hypothetical protein IJA82_00895 [Clostridia bacterium]|nr:hypothetical protein [Clostridia bacterium]